MSIHVGGPSSNDYGEMEASRPSISADPPGMSGYVSLSSDKEIEEMSNKGAGSKLRDCAKALKSPSMGTAKAISGGLGAVFGGVGALAFAIGDKSKREGFSGGYQIGERLGRVISLPFVLMSGLYLMGSKFLGGKTNKGFENLKEMLNPKEVWLKNFKVSVEKRLEKTDIDEQEEFEDLRDYVSNDSQEVSGGETDIGAVADDDNFDLPGDQSDLDSRVGDL